MDGLAEAVFIGTRFRFDGEGDGRLRHAGGGIANGGVAVAKGFARSGFF